MSQNNEEKTVVVTKNEGRTTKKIHMKGNQVVKVEVNEKPGSGAGGGSGSGGKQDEPLDAESTLKESLASGSSLTNRLFTLTPSVPTLLGLLLNKSLLIDGDKEFGVLTIQLECKPTTLTQEQKDAWEELIANILKELEEFKKENDIKGLCFTTERDEQGNVRFINVILPTPKLYDAFMQRLTDKKILTQNIEPKEKLVLQQGPNPLNPILTPFSIGGPKPKLTVGSNASKDEEDKENKPFRPTPFSMRPKPKGVL